MKPKMKQPQTEATEAETHEDSEAVVPRQQEVDGGAAREEQQQDGVATLALSVEHGRLEVPWTSGTRGGAGKGGRAGDVLVQQRLRSWAAEVRRWRNRKATVEKRDSDDEVQ
ncbi:hypothetical protein CFC21_017268 [Triticum aestivum]|uniref:Uncharacterized protein n=2 Tax=Triticum aestivum TaxID=4565 RepID=A0A3B6AYF6_WHEAT|nr:hypothetical protein CFC21_017268 [Triticum aestivum]